MSLFGRKKRKIEPLDLDKIEAEIEEENAKIAAREPILDGTVSYLTHRGYGVNGFGEDFEWSLQPKGKPA